MKKNLRIFAAFAVLIPLFMAPAQSQGAGQFDGEQLLKNWMEASSEPDNPKMLRQVSADVGFCIGYISGINNTHTLMSSMPGGRKLYCHPDNIKDGQDIEIVVQYLLTHPKERSAHASIATLAAFHDAYSCAK